MFSDKDKLDCARRELAMRIKVYKNLVRVGKMTNTDAMREIALMGAIADDYEKRTQLELNL